MPFTSFPIPTITIASLGFPVSILEYGAVVGGNCTTALNAAIAAVTATGGTVTLPPGIIKIDSTISVPINVSIIGAGSSDWAVLHGSVTDVQWIGAANGTMFTFAAGTVWTGRFGGMNVSGSFVAGCAMKCNASASGVFFDLVCTGFGTTGSAPDGVIIINGIGCVEPGTAITVSSAGSFCNFSNVTTRFNANPGLVFWGTQSIHATDMVFINCQFSGVNGLAAVQIDFADTVFFVAGGIEAGTGGTAVLIGANDTAAGGSTYGVSFFGTFINALDATSTALDVRNTPVGASHFVYGSLTGGGAGGSTEYVSTRGAAPGLCRIYGNTLNLGGAGDVTPGASPWTYTNTDYFQQQIFITGGTVNGLQLVRGGNTSPIDSSIDQVLLDPGDALIVSYTSVPTTVTVVAH